MITEEVVYIISHFLASRVEPHSTTITFQWLVNQHFLTTTTTRGHHNDRTLLHPRECRPSLSYVYLTLFLMISLLKPLENTDLERAWQA